MANIDFKDYVSHLLPSVPGCPTAIAIDAIREAAIRLCQDSLIWRENLAQGDITDGYDEYIMEPSSAARVVTTINVQYNGRTITPKTEEVLDHIDNGWRTGKSGTPFHFVLLRPDLIKFNRVPDETIVDGLSARVALKPTEDAITAGEVLYYDWRDTIICGAKSSLMLMPGKTWSNPSLGKFEGKRFTYGIGAARARSTSGHTRNGASVKKINWV